MQPIISQIQHIFCSIREGIDKIFVACDTHQDQTDCLVVPSDLKFY